MIKHLPPGPIAPLAGDKTMQVEHVTTHLYYRYPGKRQAQEAYLEIDGDTLRAAYSELDPHWIPAVVYNGRIRRIPMCNQLSVRQINDLLDDVAPLAQRVADGLTVLSANASAIASWWDNSDHVGSLDDDARKAIAEIEQVAADAADDAELRVYEVSDWLHECDITPASMASTVERLGGVDKAAAEWYGNLDSDEIIVGIDDADDLARAIQRRLDQEAE